MTETMTKPIKAESEQSLPEDVRVAFTGSPEVQAAWDDLTQIGRRDFLSWIESAKQEETRKRRIAIACDKLLRGQRRPCCYAVVPMDLYRVLGADPTAKAQWSRLDANEKRDFSDWVEASPDKETRRARVEQARALLAAGEKEPLE